MLNINGVRFEIGCKVRVIEGEYANTEGTFIGCCPESPVFVFKENHILKDLGNRIYAKIAIPGNNKYTLDINIDNIELIGKFYFICLVSRIINDEDETINDTLELKYFQNDEDRDEYLKKLNMIYAMNKKMNQTKFERKVIDTEIIKYYIALDLDTLEMNISLNDRDINKSTIHHSMNDILNILIGKMKKDIRAGGLLDEEVY